LYLETIEEVLHSGKKVFIDATGANNMLYLPLDKLAEQMRSTQREASKETNNAVTVTRPANPSLQESDRDERRQRGSR